ncbi:MAG: 4-diphosphocytidyl-2-C-methyl-D-erythritol kinase [Candidatus Kapaibacterium sp.]|nr:MAG: 4-diphosphocytidyl-2-C-methyl-D-erythritol kinase [Candidatus Kapabacteria bacterium]
MLLRRAYAKINVGLHVLGKRADGYHSIATVFVPVELHDEIVIEEADTIAIRMQPSLGIDEQDNLAYRAARLLLAMRHTTAGAKITITKHIPHGSGLGGGSSDAAATLVGLCQLWNAPNAAELLPQLALQLGSDVPFFLQPQLAYAEGRGEVLTPLPPMPPRHVLIVAPGIHISTAWAYGQLHRHSEHTRPRLLCDAVFASNVSDEFLRSVCTNDFEAVVFPLYPELARIKEQLYASGATYASLTGTGSALYGFFPSEEHTLAAATMFPTYRTFVTRTRTDTR